MARQRILIADDHPLVREGLAAAIAARCAGTTIDCAESIAAAAELARRNTDYTLLLLDYELPDADGFSGLFRMQHALGDIPIALLTAHVAPGLVVAARAIGAAGFLSKREPLEQLVTEIARLLRGEQVWPDVDAAANPDLAALQQKLATLSPAQMRVLAALARGALNKQIAASLDLTEPTVKAHLTAIFRKLGVANRLQAMLAVQPLLAPEG